MDILVHRRIGRYRAGQIVTITELDAYWNAHIEAANAMLLEPVPVEYSSWEERFPVQDDDDEELDSYEDDGGIEYEDDDQDDEELDEDE